MISSKEIEDIVSLKSNETASARYRKKFIEIEDDLATRGTKLYDKVSVDGIVREITPADICRKIAELYKADYRSVYYLTRSYWVKRKKQCGH